MYSEWNPPLATGTHRSGTPALTPWRFMFAASLPFLKPPFGMWNTGTLRRSHHSTTARCSSASLMPPPFGFFLPMVRRRSQAKKKPTGVPSRRLQMILCQVSHSSAQAAQKLARVFTTLDLGLLPRLRWVRLELFDDLVKLLYRQIPQRNRRRNVAHVFNLPFHSFSHLKPQLSSWSLIVSMIASYSLIPILTLLTTFESNSLGLNVSFPLL